MSEKIFVPHELKTIEVDAENKIFRVNGEDFGDKCSGFTITCRRYDDFDVRIELDTTVVVATYGENQQKTSEEEYETDDPWFLPTELINSAE